MANEKTGRGADQFPLRLPPGMREQIKDAAGKNGRSMNAEIVSRLEETFQEREYILKETIDKIASGALDEIRRALSEVEIRRSEDE